ncbi:unnamed protein product [Medioppia subpectinata]|uniref:DIRP domain-containing protein n=1 Tax=Medioppia subpectinata TaxID=1979941 RepID=A0A7R9KUL9_9ACAR|nr:unnamed protein product [Medioppia subpectinata]CAG2109019.1 unnamed protein product [Medioppia subpectinata]
MNDTSSPSKRLGHPMRARKRNRLIYNEDEETQFTGRSAPPFAAAGHNRKSQRIPSGGSAGYLSPHSSGVRAVGTLDKKVAQRVGLRLRTLLKLPKAHKWVCFEWFYANIDQPLFLGQNDFGICLKESFPHLKTRSLARVQWCKIRRLMGKPRRCSAAFFAEERASLNAKRNKIRHLQQQKVVDFSQYKDLPENIPLSLVIGTKVTGLLRKPQDGLFTGAIDAVDATLGTYRLTFDRNGIGTHSLPDYEVLSNDTPEFIPLNSFQTKVRPRLPMFTSPRFLELLGNQVAQALGDNDPLLAGPSPPKREGGVSGGGHIHEEGTLGGFPIKFLALLVRLSKILQCKKKKITELKAMNTEAEKCRSLQEPISHDFQKHYAQTILDLEKLNADLNDYLKAVQQYSAEIAPEQGLAPIAQPDVVKQKYLVESKELVERNLVNCSVKSEPTIDLISHLLSLMLHLRGFADSEVSAYELKSLSDTLTDIRKMLDTSNVDQYENEVEIHVNHIQTSLSHLGNLGAFSESMLEPL